MNFITKYFEDRKTNKLLIEEALRKRDEEARALAEKKAAEEKADLDKKVLMESEVPYMKRVGAEYDLENIPLAPVSERYIWNKAFIRKLREDGYVGETDSEVILDWERKTALAKAERLAVRQKEERKKSSEPWVEVVGETYDEDKKQIAVNLDWNIAFIKMLRANGYSGNSEQEIVDKWFKSLSDEIAAEQHKARYDG